MWFSEWHEAGFDIHQPGDDRRVGVVRAPRVAEAIGHDAEPLGPADPMLDGDAEAAEAAVVLLLVGAQFAAFRLALWDVQVGVVLVVARIGAVGIAACLLRQARSLATDGQVVTAAGMGWRYAGDAPGGGDDILGLQRVALLLARAMALLGGMLAGPLDQLFGAVDDQRFGLPRTDLRVALDRECWLHMLLDPLDGAANHAAIHLAEEANELLGHVAAVIQQHDQQVVFQATDFPRPAGLRLAALLGFPPSAQMLHHLLECRDADTGQAAEALAATQPRGGKQTGHRDGSFTLKEAYEPYCPVVGEPPRQPELQTSRTNFRNRSTGHLMRLVRRWPYGIGMA